MEYETRVDCQERHSYSAENRPQDIELLNFNGGGGIQQGAVALWWGDEDAQENKVAVRFYAPGTLVVKPFATHIEGAPFGRGRSDMAPCILTPSADSTNLPGDHLLVLHNDRLHLFADSGQSVGNKVLFLNSLASNPYTPFGRQALAIAVGELVDNGLTGSTGSYEEEVVVATQSGALLWMHVNDVAQPCTALGAAYHLASLGGATSNIQPRTNQSMSATWAMTQRAGDPAQIHFLDQRGGYWRVDHAGAVVMQDRELLAVSSRGWDDLGNRDSQGNVLHIATPNWAFERVSAVVVPPLSYADVITHRPWCPSDPDVVGFERAGTQYYVANNWKRANAPCYSFQGFIVHQWSGCTLDDASTSSREVWAWAVGSEPLVGPWGNLVHGIRFSPNSATSTWDISHLWASTGHNSALIGTADRLPYHDLRNLVPFVPVMTSQSIRAFNVPGGGKALVVGCPGGSVRIIQPGTMGDPATAHSLGPSPISSLDFGYGGAALACKEEASGTIRIWFGTVYEPTPRPSEYPNAAYAGQALLDSEVATSGIHSMTWAPGTGLSYLSSKLLSPGVTRGGYGVVGLCVADLLPEPPGQDELIATTLAVT